MNFDRLEGLVAELVESQKKTDRQIQETDRQIKDLNKQIGGISNNIGFHAEQYFQNALRESLTFGGEKYDGMNPNLKYQRKNINAEFDIVLVNKSIEISKYGLKPY